jgi:hypothetical protein
MPGTTRRRPGRPAVYRMLLLTATSPTWSCDLSNTVKSMTLFQYEEFADLAPRPTRQLQKTDVGDDQACPLQTMEAEEMSNEGTKSWLIHLARSQLALGDNTLAEVLVMVYGDLGTVKVIIQQNRT